VTAPHRLLVCLERFTADLDWRDLARLLPEWESSPARPGRSPSTWTAWPWCARSEPRLTGPCWTPGRPLLLALVRRLDSARAALSSRHWPERPTGGSLLGATVLIVGLGAIGAEAARRLAPFGTRLLAVRAHPELGGPPEVERVAGPDELPELLGEADATVCCAMFDARNAGMFGADEFAAMRPGALFVNVARGGLVNEDALLAALQAGQVGGAGLDVHAREPADPDSVLLRHPAVIATPHVGGVTEVMFRRTEVIGANLRRWVDGAPPRWAVNTPGFCRWPPGHTSGR
jgi:phosphoglycerate dehydrogenase-like enzyme